MRQRVESAGCNGNHAMQSIRIHTQAEVVRRQDRLVPYCAAGFPALCAPKRAAPRQARTAKSRK